MRWSRSQRHGSAKVILLAVVALTALGFAGWFLWKPKTQPDVDEGRAVAESFLTNIREGRADAAWQSTTAEFKSDEGKESFLRDVKPVKFLTKPLAFVSVQTVTVQDQPRSEYLFRAETGETARVVLAQEESEWKVDRWTR